MARNLKFRKRKHLAADIVRIEYEVYCTGRILTPPWGRLLCCVVGLYPPGCVVTVPFLVNS